MVSTTCRRDRRRGLGCRARPIRALRRLAVVRRRRAPGRLRAAPSTA